MKANITNYNPEDKVFWENEGKKIASTNLWVSVFNLMLAFIVWYVFSTVVVNLNKVGYNLTPAQIFNLVSLPGLIGATLRIFYGFLIPKFGGRNFTIFSTLTLLIPAIGIGMVSQDPTTPYWVLVMLALLSGFGCANFSSSNANIPPFFPKAKQGGALGINGGLGNLGVSVVQFATPILISTSAFVWIFGDPQLTKTGQTLYLQNASYFWILPLIICVIFAYFKMNNLKSLNRASIKDQLVIFNNKHTYIIMTLYIMTFGGFAGFAAAFPTVLNIKFPNVNTSHIIFIGPMLAALIRPFGGMLADKYHKGVISLLVFLGIGVCLYTLTLTNDVVVFISIFIFLFFLTGVGNGAVFALNADYFNVKEKGAAVGFVSAIGAYGAFFIPQIFKYSISNTGEINQGLYIIFAFNVICILLTYIFYIKQKNSHN